MKKAQIGFLSRHWLNVLESVDHAMLVLDRESNVEFMNEPAAQLTGQSAAQATGGHIRELFAENPWILEIIDARASHARATRYLDGTFLDRNAQSIPVRASATPLVESDGTPVGGLLTLQNLTHQRALEARAHESDKLGELETLVAGLAHEIRNPLSGMRGAAQLLVAGQIAPERVRECSNIMLDEIDRLEGLLSQLVELSGNPRIERVAVNIHRILDHVIAIEGPTEATTRFSRNYDPSLPAVSGDPNRLTQVLLNLVRNALEASPPEGKVVLTTRLDTSYRIADPSHDGRFLKIDIEDEGSGIAPAQLERIFAPFFTTKNSGTGLGLAISKRIINEHGGTIRARSRTPRGATFTVTLPLDPGNDHGS